MATATPTTDSIPASHLIRERDYAQQRVREQREENDRLAARLDAALEREVAACDRANVAAKQRDIAQQAADHLADRCRQAESALAELQAERVSVWREIRTAARLDGERDVAKEVEALRALVAIAEATATDYRSQLCEILAGDAGKDCPECNGTGSIADERMVGDPGDDYGYRILPTTSECDACFDGRVAK